MQARLTAAFAAALLCVLAQPFAAAAQETESTQTQQDVVSAEKGAPPEAQIAASWPNVAPPGTPLSQRGTKKLPYARPGQTVTLNAAASNDLDGTIASYDWSVIAVNGRNEERAVAGLGNTPAVNVPTLDGDRLLKATLKVTDDAGLTATTTLTVKVTPNVPPTISLDRIKKILARPSLSTATQKTVPPQVPIKGAAEVTAALNVTRIGKPATVYANGADPDGRIVTYAFDVDAVDGDFERSPGRGLLALARDETTFVPSAPGKKTVRVRVTDDEGGVSEAALELNVISQCGGTEVTKILTLNVRPLTGCLKPIKFSGKDPVSWEFTNGTINVNGLTVAAAKLGFEKKANGRLVITSDAASVDSVAANGVRVSVAAGKIAWGITDKGEIVNLKLDGGMVGGLKINQKLGVARFVGDKVQFKLLPFTPPVYGGSTASEPIDFTSAGVGVAMAQASRRGGPTATAAVEAFTFKVPRMDIAGMEIIDVTLSYDGDDSWDISGTFEFSEPFPIDRIKAAAGIRDGDFGYLTADTTFKPALPVLGQVYLEGMRFTLDFGTGLRSECVPKVGKEKESRQALRDFYVTWGGVPKDKVYPMAPDLEFDYGIPTFQFCGALDFHVGQNKSFAGNYIANGTISVGIAKYADRPGVFRIKGKPLNILGAEGSALFELYGNGYINADLKAKYEFDKTLRFRASLGFQAKFPQFNAKAYAEACILKWDLGCAAATILVSSKGIGACLGIDTIVGEWTPGATYVWGGSFTPYLQGCDVNDVKVVIKGGGNSVKVQELPEGAIASAAQVKEDLLAPGTVVPLTIKAGLPGAVFAVRGQGGLPKFTLTSPGKQALVVDDQPSARKFFDRRQAGPVVLKDVADGLTQVMVRGVQPGEWTVRIDGERPASVRLMEGAPKPTVQSQVLANGRQRQLNLAVKDVRPNMSVKVMEFGATGAQELGEFKLGRGQTTKKPFKFTPAAQAAEKRTVRLVFERNGMPVAIKDLKPFGSSRPTAPGPPKLLQAKRTIGGLALRWKPGSGASRYIIKIKLNDGRIVSFRTAKTATTVKIKLAKFNAAVVAVQSQDEYGKVSKPATATVKALVAFTTPKA